MDMPLKQSLSNHMTSPWFPSCLCNSWLVPSMSKEVTQVTNQAMKIFLPFHVALARVLYGKANLGILSSQGKWTARNFFCSTQDSRISVSDTHSSQENSEARVQDKRWGVWIDALHCRNPYVTDNVTECSAAVRGWGFRLMSLAIKGHNHSKGRLMLRNWLDIQVQKKEV